MAEHLSEGCCSKPFAGRVPDDSDSDEEPPAGARTAPGDDDVEDAAGALGGPPRARGYRAVAGELSPGRHALSVNRERLARAEDGLGSASGRPVFVGYA